MGFAGFSALVLSECENTWTFSVVSFKYSVSHDHVMYLHTVSSMRYTASCPISLCIGIQIHNNTDRS